MEYCKSVYEPREDSTMLERYVRQFAKGRVLDIGTGSGIQAIAAAENKNVISVLAVDVQKEVVDYCKGCIRHKKISFLQSDLFENISGKFDTIIFNPPYLPQELQVKDLTDRRAWDWHAFSMPVFDGTPAFEIEGGRNGYEIIQRFICEVNRFLSEDGIILMIFSSLTKKEKVEEFIKNNLLEFEELEKTHIFFEDIYAYLLRKNEFLKRLESKGIAKIERMAKGHRGIIFAGIYKNKKVAIKAKNPESKAVGRLENEARWLKKLRSYRIAPQLVMTGDGYFAYKFIDGDFIIEHMRKSGSRLIKKVIKDVLNQMFILDNLKVDKEEMHRPLKHIIVAKNKPYLIDFERAHFAKSPKNVTQFCQFLMSGRVSQMLASKKINIEREKIIKLAKAYKSRQSSINFNKIIEMI